MATIKIPGKIFIDKIDKDNGDNSASDDENDSISEHISFEEIDEKDPLDHDSNIDIDFDEDAEPNEHADLNIDDIAGNASGYDSPLVRLEQEIKLAEHDEKNNKVDESLRHRIRITALSKIAYPVNHWKISKYQVDLAHSYIDLLGSRYAAQCEDHATEALKALSAFPEEIFNPKECSEFLQALISAHYGLARAELILKKTEESEKNINKALMYLKKLENLSILTDEEVFPISLKLNMASGKICLRLQKLTSASNFYNIACSMIQANKGEESVDLIPIYQFLGKIEQSNGNLSNHNKAIEYYLKAHSLANKNYENHSEQVIQTSRAVANAYSIIGTIDSEKSAEVYLNECIQSAIINYGENHSFVTEIETDLARLLIRSDRNSEAVVKLKSILEKEEKIFGEYSEPVLTTCQLLGSLQLSSGNSSKALKYFEKALLIEELQNGPKSKVAKSIKESISTITNMSSRSSASSTNKTRMNTTYRPK